MLHRLSAATWPGDDHRSHREPGFQVDAASTPHRPLRAIHKGEGNDPAPWVARSAYFSTATEGITEDFAPVPLDQHRRPASSDTGSSDWGEAPLAVGESEPRIVYGHTEA